MSTFYFKTEQFLSISIEKAWSFFSSSKNLALITPPELDFKIISADEKKEIYEGMLIEYKVKPLLGIPIYWQTEIFKINKPIRFTDKQLKGPYKVWEHTHIFIEMNHGVLMKDEVKYQMPFGFIGNMVQSLIVKKKIENIFVYRREVLNKLFNK